MRIAVNTRFFLTDYPEEAGYFIFEIFRRIVFTHPEHEFIFIFDRPYDKKFVFAENVTAVVTGTPARHPLLWKYWYDVKVPSVLKKYKADVFVSSDGFCSLTTKTPQCLLLHDLSFLHYSSFTSRLHFLFYKYYTPKFLRKAEIIVTVSEFEKKDILSKYKIDADKINVVPNAAKEIFHPLNDKEKEVVKNKFTSGKEYFINTGAMPSHRNLTHLLKAFSIFKKKQNSNWKLVLTGRPEGKYRAFAESLKSYKYREDVVLTGILGEEEMVKVTGSAYALVYPLLWKGFSMPVLEAMRCDVPVITSENSAMQEIAEDAALYANPNDHNDIAEKMMLLYKDENLRRRLIERGIKISDQYNSNKSAELLWQCIMKAVV